MFLSLQPVWGSVNSSPAQYTIGANIFFPLDDELALTGSRLTPKQQEHLAHLGSCLPFACAARMLEKLLGVQISEPTVRRGTERAGARYEEVQTAQSQQDLPDASQKQGKEPMIFSTDGAYVPLVGGGWAEVRTVAIGHVQQKPCSGANPAQARELSYFSRMTDAQTFGDLAQGEMHRRGISQARQVSAVTDGAPWIQGFIDLHRQDAVRILDFAHAAEHVGLLVEAFQQAGVRFPEDVVKRSLHVLKHRGPSILLRWGDCLSEAISAQEAVQTHLDYFRKRLPLLDYPGFRRQGWPIGSGMVESANKLVVQARLKGAGMHWQPSHVNPMLALRGAICSGRWDEAWRQIVHQEQTLRTTARREQAQHRCQALVSSTLLLLLRFRSPTASPPPPLPSPLPRPAHPTATLPGSSCPSAHHPWKRGLFRRPPSLAKT